MPRFFTIDDVQENLAAVFASLDESDEPVIVERAGQSRIVILSSAAYERLDRQRQLDLAWEAVDRARARLAHIPDEEIDRDIDEIVAEIRRDKKR